MRLEHESAENLKAKLRAIVGKHVDLSQYKLFFFGSRVQGRGDERSDVDVGIEGPQGVPGHVMEEIREAIESLPVLYKIDIVDFYEVSDDFRRVALQAVERIE